MIVCHSSGACRYHALAAAVAAAMLLVIAVGAQAQDQTPLLILSQPATGVSADRFVDLSPHLQPALQQTGRYNVTVYRSTDAAIQNALQSGQLKPSEVRSPITGESAHHIARLLNMRAILFVSASTSKDGVDMAAQLELLSGQNTWSQVYIDKVTAEKETRKRASLLESIHGLVDRIVQGLTNSSLQPLPIVTPHPADVPTNPGDKVTQPVNKAVTSVDKTPGPGDRAQAVGNPSATAGSPGKTAQSTALPAAPKRDGVSTYELVIDRARRNGDVASLIVALRKAIDERPHDIRLRRDLAAAYKDRGRMDLAKEEATRAAALAPEDGAVHRLMGDVLRESGDPAAALKEYQEAVRIAPQDPQAHMALGDALLADRRNDEALKEFQAAAQADAKSPAPQLRIARLHMRKGAYTDALAALTVANSLAGGSALVNDFPADCGAVLTVVESTLTETLPRLQQARVAFLNGTKTREDAFKEVTALRKKADEVSVFLDGMPDIGLNRAQALYGQAASLAVQAADKLLEHLETQSTSAAEECNLLRIEANRQIGEAAKRLKSILDSKGPAR